MKGKFIAHPSPSRLPPTQRTVSDGEQIHTHFSTEQRVLEMYREMYSYDKDIIQLWEPHGIKELVFSNKVRGETGPKE